MEKSKYKFRSNTVVLMGDTHSTEITSKIVRIIENGSDVIHLGDNGLGFGSESYALKNAEMWITMLNDLCLNKDIILYILRGNHDNPEVWNLSSLSNVILVKDGEIAIFPNGKKALLTGGGISLDRCVRIKGESYWEDEITSDFEVKKADVIFSHDTSDAFNRITATLGDHWGWYMARDKMLWADCYKQRNCMGDIIEKSGAKLIYYGHHHNDWREFVGGVRGQCVNIEEVLEVDAENFIVNIT